MVVLKLRRAWLWAFVLPLFSHAALSATEIDGATIYAQRCAMCHDNATGRIPTRAALREALPEAIVAALNNGAMRIQATGMSADEINAVALHVSAKPFGAGNSAQNWPNACKQTGKTVSTTKVHWNGWGQNIANTRYQPAPGFSVADLPKLKLKWAYAYTGRYAQGQPTLVNDNLLVSNLAGEVSLLDMQTGCERWTFKADASVKTALTIGTVRVAAKEKTIAFFGDERAKAYAVDLSDGTLVWSTTLDTHVAARTVGSPVFHEGRVYVPMSSAEESASRDAKYPCCTFRGSLSALDAATGKVIWKSFPIAEEPKAIKISTAGTQTFGPAGAAIWSAPTIDTKRGSIYVATGNSYSDADTDGNDAIIAFDLKTGARKWVNQVHPDDNFVLGCSDRNRGEGNCPQDGGPDYDFGSSPILQTLPNGKQLIFAGQKSGIAYALDPDSGKLVWKQQVGKGSPLGGIEWGIATDGASLFAPVSDAGARDGRPGITALDLASGKELWHVPTPEIECSWGKDMCRRGQPGAPTVIPGAVFSGALDGHLRAYESATGKILWDVDTAKPIAVVNGPVTAGGAIDSGGITIANGMVFVTSGYGRWGKAGRLLLAFSIEEQ